MVQAYNKTRFDRIEATIKDLESFLWQPALLLMLHFHQLLQSQLRGG